LEGKALAQSIANQISNAINKNIPDGFEKETTTKIFQNGENQTEIIIDFPNNRPNLIRLEKALIEVKGLEEKVMVKRSQEKDFNEDLQKNVSHKLPAIPQNGLFQANHDILLKVSNISNHEARKIAKNASKEGNKIDFWGKNGYLESKDVSPVVIENKKTRFKTEFEIIREIEPRGLLLQKQEKGYKISEKLRSLDDKQEFPELKTPIENMRSGLKK
jgi:hypothetical protein